MQYPNPWQSYGYPFHAQYAAANPYYASQYYGHAQASSHPHSATRSLNAARKGTSSLMQSEWSAQFGPTLVFMVVSAGILWFKIYGGKLVGDKAQA
jgi:hypothetical protein